MEITTPLNLVRDINYQAPKSNAGMELAETVSSILSGLAGYKNISDTIEAKAKREKEEVERTTLGEVENRLKNIYQTVNKDEKMSKDDIAKYMSENALNIDFTTNSISIGNDFIKDTTRTKKEDGTDETDDDVKARYESKIKALSPDSLLKVKAYINDISFRGKTEEELLKLKRQEVEFNDSLVYEKASVSKQEEISKLLEGKGDGFATTIEGKKALFAIEEKHSTDLSNKLQSSKYRTDVMNKLNDSKIKLAGDIYTDMKATSLNLVEQKVQDISLGLHPISAISTIIDTANTGLDEKDKIVKGTIYQKLDGFIGQNIGDVASKSVYDRKTVKISDFVTGWDSMDNEEKAYFTNSIGAINDINSRVKEAVKQDKERFNKPLSEESQVKNSIAIAFQHLQNGDEKSFKNLLAKNPLYADKIVSAIENGIQYNSIGAKEAKLFQKISSSFNVGKTEDGKLFDNINKISSNLTALGVDPSKMTDSHKEQATIMQQKIDENMNKYTPKQQKDVKLNINKLLVDSGKKFNDSKSVLAMAEKLYYSGTALSLQDAVSKAIGSQTKFFGSTTSVIPVGVAKTKAEIDSIHLNMKRDYVSTAIGRKARLGELDDYSYNVVKQDSGNPYSANIVTVTSKDGKLVNSFIKPNIDDYTPLKKTSIISAYEEDKLKYKVETQGTSTGTVVKRQDVNNSRKQSTKPTIGTVKHTGKPIDVKGNIDFNSLNNQTIIKVK